MSPPGSLGWEKRNPTHGLTLYPRKDLPLHFRFALSFLLKRSIWVFPFGALDGANGMLCTPRTMMGTLSSGWQTQAAEVSPNPSLPSPDPGRWPGRGYYLGPALAPQCEGHMFVH